MNTKTTSDTSYQLVTGFIGNIPNSFAPGYFDSYQAAADYFKKEYTERKKGDNHDKYWNDLPLCVRVITTVTTDFY